MNYLSEKVPDPPRLDREPHPHADRRDVVPEELTVWRGTRIGLEQHAPPPTRSGRRQRVAELQAAHHAPPDPPATILDRFRIQRGDESAGREPPNPQQRPAGAILQTAVDHRRLQVGG